MSPFIRGNTIQLESLLASPLRELWARFPALAPWTTDAAGPLPPFYPTQAQLERVVVLGLNPSYTEAHRSFASYSVDKAGNAYFRNIAKFMDQAARKYEALFQLSPQVPGKPLYHFGALEWLHLDLLYVRTTSQQALEKQLWATPAAASFVWEQLQLTKKLLVQLEPTMLVVANKFGQTLTGFNRKFEAGQNAEVNEWMGLQFAATPNEFGAYRITGSTTAGTADNDQILRLVGTPVFFTGSLASTNRRVATADEKLTARMAAAYSHEGDRYFQQWHMGQ